MTAVVDGRRLFPWGDDLEPGYCHAHVASPPSADAAPGRLTPGEAVQAAESMRKLVRMARQEWVPARVGTHARDVSPFGCRDMAGNVSEWVILERDSEGRPILAAMGGNASSLGPRSICPVMKKVFVPLQKKSYVLGLRTVLPLPSGEGSPE